MNLLKAIENLQAAESFLEKLTEQYFSENCEIIEHKFYLDTKKFFLLDEFIQDRVILLWLCKTGVKFTPTSKLFDEIKINFPKAIVNGRIDRKILGAEVFKEKEKFNNDQKYVRKIFNRFGKL